MRNIAVVTVVRNDLEGLKRTVKSLGRQDASVFEHVIVDGASTDGTPEYLLSLSTQHALTYVSEPDNGLYDAMNKALTLVKSPVVQFLNAADELAHDDVLAQVSCSWEREGWNWAFGGIRYVDETGVSLGEFLGQPYDRRAVECGRSYVPHQATFASRETLLALGGFRHQFGLSSDQELLLRLGENAAPHEFPEIFSLMQAGGAHSTSTPMARAHRYRRIRQDHNSLIAGNTLIDLIFTTSQGLIREARRIVRERLLGRPRI